MAFATTYVRSIPICAGQRKLTGRWTGSSGDAAGTITVASARIYSYDFNNQDSDSPKEKPDITVSTSSGKTTVSVHNHMNVTTGGFEIICA